MDLIPLPLPVDVDLYPDAPFFCELCRMDGTQQAAAPLATAMTLIFSDAMQVAVSGWEETLGSEIHQAIVGTCFCMLDHALEACERETDTPVPPLAAIYLYQTFEWSARYGAIFAGRVMQAILHVQRAMRSFPPNAPPRAHDFARIVEPFAALAKETLDGLQREVSVFHASFWKRVRSARDRYAVPAVRIVDALRAKTAPKEATASLLIDPLGTQASDFEPTVAAILYSDVDPSWTLPTDASERSVFEETAYAWERLYQSEGRGTPSLEMVTRSRLFLQALFSAEEFSALIQWLDAEELFEGAARTLSHYREQPIPHLTRDQFRCGHLLQPTAVSVKHDEVHPYAERMLKHAGLEALIPLFLHTFEEHKENLYHAIEPQLTHNRQLTRH